MTCTFTLVSTPDLDVVGYVFWLRNLASDRNEAANARTYAAETWPALPAAAIDAMFCAMPKVNHADRSVVVAVA